MRLICAILCSIAWLHAAQAQNTTELTLSEARTFARSAVVRGDAVLAMQITDGLLQANPRDADALLIRSAAQTQLKQYREGRITARQAYRYGDVRTQKLEAAVLAARHALLDERPTLTQIWLRRAALHTKTDDEKAQIAQDYARVRDANPWGLRADFGLRPSSNVNNGSDSSRQVIDGVTVVGSLSGSGQALSGMIGTVDLGVTYRVSETQRSRTTLGGRLLVQRVWLTDRAKEISPTSKNRDFGATYVEASVNHLFAVGQKPGNFGVIGAAVGKSWYGGDENFQSFALSGRRIWQTSQQMQWYFGGYLQRRDDAGTSIGDTVTLSLTGGFDRVLASGDRAGLSLNIAETDSDSVNRAFTSLSVQATYAFAQQFGPAKVSTSLVVSETDYPIYDAGITLVPGGRQDRSAFLTMDFLFPDLDYAGFAPELSVRLGKRSSNVSRFDISETSVGLGIQSKF